MLLARNYIRHVELIKLALLRASIRLSKLSSLEGVINKEVTYGLVELQETPCDLLPRAYAH